MRWAVHFRPLLLAALLCVAACGGGGGPVAMGADFSQFDSAIITVGGVEFNVWIADTVAERAQGLMQATATQLLPDPQGRPRGMLFVFPAPAFPGFTMEQTFVPLDLAFARADGTIVEVHARVPLDPTVVRPNEPVQFALEVPAGTLAANGLGPGDVIVVP